MQQVVHEGRNEANVANGLICASIVEFVQLASRLMLLIWSISLYNNELSLQ